VTGAELPASACATRTMQPGITKDVSQSILACFCAQPRPHLLTVRCPVPTIFADTRTNIQILADAFASQAPEGRPHHVHVEDTQPPGVYNAETKTHIAFFNGVGTSGHEDEVRAVV
jgi:hypothetical protein